MHWAPVSILNLVLWWHSSPFCSFLRRWQLACHLHLTHLGWALVLVGAWCLFSIGILWQSDFDDRIYDSWLHGQDILVEGGAAHRSSHILLICLVLLVSVICWRFGVASSLQAPLLCHQYRLLCVELLPTLVSSGWTWPRQHGIYLGLLPVLGLLSWVNETLFCHWWYHTRGSLLLGFRWGPRTHMSWLCYADLLRIRQWFHLVFSSVYWIGVVPMWCYFVECSKLQTSLVACLASGRRLCSQRLACWIRPGRQAREVKENGGLDLVTGSCLGCGNHVYCEALFPSPPVLGEVSV